MSQLQHTHSRSQPFTISEVDTEEMGTVLVAGTKRYRFYWLVGEEPILIRVLDFDGTDVTGAVDPPDGMVQRVAQH